MSNTIDITHTYFFNFNIIIKLTTLFFLLLRKGGKTMNKLLELAKTKVGCGYVWGSQGEILTKELLEKFKKTFGVSHYEFSGGISASKWIGYQVFDCSGLIIWCLTELGYLTKGTDYTADGIYHKLCTPISKNELKPGDLLFNQTSDRIVHVGIYAGDNYTLHAAGTSKGVILNKDMASFNKYGRLKFDLEMNEDKPDVVPPTEKPIMTGTVNSEVGLNVRSGPSINHSRITVLKHKSKVSIYEVKEGWYRIGVGKWVSCDYVIIDKVIVTPTPTPSEIEVLIERLLDCGIVTNGELWESVLKGEKPVNIEYLKIAFTNACNKIQKR